MKVNDNLCQSSNLKAVNNTHALYSISLSTKLINSIFNLLQGDEDTALSKELPDSHDVMATDLVVK